MKNSIRELREKNGYTQDDLALAAGVSRQTIISLEKGKYNPSIQLAFKLSKIFNLSIEEIFIYEEE
ncbi:helix-turn-helix transcriptional regulator [Clostridium sp. PL3]|uniref:Helix-turn-helix transcriptional regulator n=1 Tax=Clostridium thailandense TaxID=2794346 RepID=A0A949TWL5_9CLOT|nr:helix-turn-helix transcriptional regulator [Clostridium thailandense]MBV7271739.1 helix-turn-helix transcriptional regulator [Clostridium thailandense]